ncbi:MAG: GatB/YqeY domain-containing protein [Paludibacteraceae bacterium]|nr:GatB/YqeY domain-containing protein [Paludibacteraceae bacterium]
MDFIEKITGDIKTAMLAKDHARLETLRGIKKELLEAKTAKGAEDVLSEATVQRILQKMVKQRRESAVEYAAAGRKDLADEETTQADIIAEYMPKQLTDSELEAAVKAIIAETGASSIKDLGKVMGIASRRLAGQADGKAVSDKAKSLLG